MPDLVTVAIPTCNGAAYLPAVLAAVRAQRLEPAVEIVVIDSGSTDGSPELCAAAGARVEHISPDRFSHGGTRNTLMELSRGDHVAFLSQDAIPAHDRWLAALIAAFELAGDVGLAFGPYLPRPDASPMVRRELEDFFAGFTPGLVRGASGGALGPRTFFTSANGAVSRAAWRAVPFRDVPYAEDQRLAADMLAAGFAKAYVPEAGVVHSHDYPPMVRFRRWFDEFRALREVHGFRAPLAPRPVLGRIRAEVAADRAVAGDAIVWESLRYHALRALGAGLGSRADRLPPPARRWCSLERRETFVPSHPR